MKKIGSKVLLMMVLFVVIFGLNTITSVTVQILQIKHEFRVFNS